VLDADEMHAATMRLDYILANRFVRPLRSARAIVNEDTCRLSDHYPVVAEFRVTSRAVARGESGTP
jgi:endonuclease/exonuclease/phosphatase family metal-dependent hydrolase